MPDILPIGNRKAAPKFAFTAQRLEKFNPPGAGRVWLTDAQCTDLRMQVTSAGSKSFYVYRKYNGKPVRVLIGDFPTVGIDAARKQARTIVGQMIMGIDPREVKREARQADSFGELAEAYIEMHAKPKKKSWQEDQRQIDYYLSGWKGRTLPSIKREHVATLHAKLGTEHGRYQANRVLALISSIFTFAERQRGWVGTNPAKGIGRFAEVKRDRFLQPNELPKFFAAVEEEPSQTIRDYVYVSLLTGARKGNVLAMRWEDVDLDGRTWRIPDTKSGKPVTLPLVDDVVRILSARHRGGEWVFPSRVGTGHLVSPGKAWRAILKRAGLSNLRPHDLRRTLGSWQAAAGVSLPIIGKSLGHTSTAATEIYSRLHLEPVRAAVTLATSAILKAGAEKAVKS